jgi:nitrile hydratase accessory protein
LSLSEDFAALPRPREAAEGPVFAEPWHAEVLAVACALTATGLFSTHEWAGCLGSALGNARRNGEPDTEDTYYRSALRALEQLVAERSPEIATRLEVRVEEWRSAYLDTPHGKPVELAGGRQMLSSLRHRDRPDGRSAWIEPGSEGQ